MTLKTKNWADLSYNNNLSKNFVHSFLFDKKDFRINLLAGIFEYFGHLEDASWVETVAEKLKTYYFDDKIWNEEITDDLQELQFESTLQKLNNRLNNLISSTPEINPQMIRMLVISIFEDKNRNNFKLCLSQAGKRLKGVILHRLKGGGFKIIEITDNENPINHAVPYKFFKHISTGLLTSADQILLANDSLFETVSQDEIKRSIINLPVISALEHLKSQVTRARESFAGVIIKMPMEEGAIIQSAASTKKRTGSAKLFQTENATEKVMAPNIWHSLKNGLRRLSAPMAKTKTVISHAYETASKGIRVSLHYLSSTIVSVFNRDNFTKLIGSITWGVSIVRNLLVWVATKILKVLTWGFRTTLSLVKRFSAWFFSLNRKQKLSFVGGIFVVMLFLQSIFWIGRIQAKAKEEKLYKKLVIEIQDKIDRADAAIIFKEDDRAQINLTEAENLASQLPQDTEGRIETFSKIQSQIRSKYNQISNIVELDNPQILAEFSDGVPQKIAITGRKLVVTGTEKKIWLVNKKSGEINQPQNLPAYSQAWPWLVADNQAAYLFDQGMKLLVYVADENRFEARATPLKKDYQIRDLTLYDQKLYVLEENSSQIYRFGQALGGFAGEAVKWFKDSPSLLNQTVSLAIDNNIYLLKADGSILKLFGGFSAKPGFTKPEVKPGILAPTKIYTQENSPYLYILDPPTKRIVIITKTGDWSKQYLSNQFDSLKDFAVDEPNQKIYFLSSNKIYSVDLILK